MTRTQGSKNAYSQLATSKTQGDLSCISTSPRETKRKFFIRRVGAPGPPISMFMPQVVASIFPDGPADRVARATEH